jgi:hypothetical protein
VERRPNPDQEIAHNRGPIQPEITKRSQNLKIRKIKLDKLKELASMQQKANLLDTRVHRATDGTTYIGGFCTNDVNQYWTPR